MVGVCKGTGRLPDCEPDSLTITRENAGSVEFWLMSVFGGAFLFATSRIEILGKNPKGQRRKKRVTNAILA
jgi:hypothetical protein